MLNVFELSTGYGMLDGFNFNGTAGVWRREAIDDAGGWLDDTVTEDLDLSVRASMQGWRLDMPITWLYPLLQ